MRRWTMACLVLAWTGVAACGQIEPLPPVSAEWTNAVTSAGTRAFYEQYIQGRYRYADGRMEPLMTMPRRVFIRGEVAQVLDATNLVLRVASFRPSGARESVACLLAVQTTAGFEPGRSIATNALGDGLRRCVTESGTTNTVQAFRLSSTAGGITFEEYRDVFEKESQTGPLEKIVRVERVADVYQPPSGVIRGMAPSSGPPDGVIRPPSPFAAPPGSVGDGAAAERARSYRERLMERERLRQQRDTGNVPAPPGAAGPPGPPPSTPVGTPSGTPLGPPPLPPSPPATNVTPRTPPAP